MVDQPYLTWKHGHDVINVKSTAYAGGAVGNGIVDDTAAIRAAVAAFFAPGGGYVLGTLYFPPGNYKVTSKIDIGLFSGATISTGRICGAGIGATVITGVDGGDGTITNDAVLNCSPNGHNGPQEISDMTIQNTSTKVGSCALRYCQVNGVARNLHCIGQTALDLGAMNTFNMTVSACQLSAAQNLVQGTVGLLCSGGIITGMHFSSDCGEIGILASGETVTIDSVTFENVCVGMQIGSKQTLATQCTITNIAGTDTLTVGASPNFGELYPDPNQIFSEDSQCFKPSDILYGTGIPPGQQVTINVQLTQTDAHAGGRGTYSLNNASGITISSPQAIIGRRTHLIEGCNISSIESEAVGTVIDIRGGIGITIKGCALTGAANQAPALSGASYFMDANREPLLPTVPLILAGNVGVSSSVCGISIESCSGLHLDTVSVAGFYTQGAVKFSNAGTYTGLTMTGVLGAAAAPAITDTNAFIDNGAGATAVTTASTSSGSVLTFGSGTMPAAMPAGTPVYNVTHSTSLGKYAYVLSQTLTTVTLGAAVVSTVSSGDTIKFGVPTGTNGNVLTIPGALSSGRVASGGAVSGAGISTGANTPIIADQLPLGFGSDGGTGFSQYLLACPGGNFNVGREQITISYGGACACSSVLPDLTSLDSHTKASISIDYKTCVASSLGMKFLDLPAQSGVLATLTQEGAEFDIVDGLAGNCADAACTTFGTSVTGGGGALHLRVRWNAARSAWTLMGR